MHLSASTTCHYAFCGGSWALLPSQNNWKHQETRNRTITFRNGIIEDFEPRFKSIGKDHDRYFDALVALSETGVIETNDVLRLSGDGSLWIAYQYIDKGLFDLVESDLKKAVASRDFLGPLFENTRLVLERLLEVSEEDRVIAVYRAAITHRLRAMRSEVAFWEKARKKHPPGATSKWIKHYRPPLKKMINDYRELLARIDRSDAELEEFEQAMIAFESV